LRLLKLPAEIQLGLKDKTISMGHARALINIEDKDLQLALFAKTIEENLSVRDIEELAKYGKIHSKVKAKVKKVKAPLSLTDKKIQEKLELLFKNKVQFNRNQSGAGNLTLKFKNDEELQHLLSILDIE